MGKRLRDILIPTVVGCSIAFNIFLVLVSQRNEWRLSWSRRAAEEAEFVAEISCSDHGRAYVDGLTRSVNGKAVPVCECNSCFVGPDCSQYLPSCPADVDGGDPCFLEPFWRKNAVTRSGVMVGGWHRMGYSYKNESIMSKELENHIRKLHEVVGNAVIQGRYIMFGVGSTQLLNAAIHALSPENSTSPARVVASAPYYGLFRQQTKYFESASFKFEGDAKLWKNISSNCSSNLIELVTSPNNPDGQLKKAVLSGPNVKTIHDLVFYWPHYTPISAPADEDIMLFSLSKLTGHAGSRFGWAVVKDEKVFRKMYNHVDMNTLGVSMDAQLRALQLIKVAIGHRNEKALFDFGYTTLNYRWEKLKQTLSLSRRFSIQKIEPQHCTFFKTDRGASPASAWMKCERKEDKDCYEVLRGANIISRRGSEFDAEERFVRLSLVKTKDDFDQLLHRLKALVAQEYQIQPLTM